jgi:hypothetical protein
MDQVGGPLGLVVAIFVVILSVLWFLLPFAVFGVKARLDQVIKEMRHQNVLLTEIARGGRLDGKAEPRI